MTFGRVYLVLQAFTLIETKGEQTNAALPNCLLFYYYFYLFCCLVIMTFVVIFILIAVIIGAVVFLVVTGWALAHVEIEFLAN